MIKVPCLIIDKEKKSGWFSDSYYLVFKTGQPLKKKIIKSCVNMECYYRVEIGKTYNVYFYKLKNGNYTYDENDPEIEE